MDGNALALLEGLDRDVQEVVFLRFRPRREGEKDLGSGPIGMLGFEGYIVWVKQLCLLAAPHKSGKPLYLGLLISQESLRQRALRCRVESMGSQEIFV